MSVILVTDAEQRSALATVRSLGRAGHIVYVASSQRRPLAGASKYARGVSRTPDPLAQPDEFAAAIIGEVSRLGVELLLPVTDASVLALLPHRDKITARLPFPSAEAFARLCDKHVVANEAMKLGLRAPRTIRLNSAADRAAIPEQKLSFPLVLKSLQTINVKSGARVKHQVTYHVDEPAFERAVSALHPEDYPVLVQERIDGPGIGIFLILHHGEVAAAFAHRRLREKPPSGGVSVLRESVALEPELLEKSAELLRRFDFEGAAMIEYKIDARTNTPYIMEINGRLWGSLQLAIDAGVDFPAILAATALNGALPQQAKSYSVGVKSRWFWGDVDHLLTSLRGNGPRVGKQPSRLKAVRDFLSGFAPGVRGEILRFEDPRPAVRETAEWFTSVLRIRHR